jgi:hypothetical protein
MGSLVSWSHHESAGDWLADSGTFVAPARLLDFWFRLQVQPKVMSPALSADMRPHR